MIYLFLPGAGKGFITRASDSTGKWAFDPFPGKNGDTFNLWASRWEDDSGSSIVCVVVDDTRSKGYTECTP